MDVRRVGVRGQADARQDAHDEQRASHYIPIGRRFQPY